MQLKDITFKNVKAFIQGHARHIMDELDLLPTHISEQVLWRAKKAEACTENKACLYCGCSTEDLELYYADLGCKDPDRQCYPKMMNEEEWNKYKLEHADDFK